MTFDEKRRVATEAEILKLREISTRLAVLVSDAQELAKDCAESLARFTSIKKAEDDADSAMSRYVEVGRAARARKPGDELSAVVVDITRGLGDSSC